jgi:hypothetical protein
VTAEEHDVCLGASLSAEVVTEHLHIRIYVITPRRSVEDTIRETDPIARGADAIAEMSGHEEARKDRPEMTATRHPTHRRARLEPSLKSDEQRLFGSENRLACDLDVALQPSSRARVPCLRRPRTAVGETALDGVENERDTRCRGGHDSDLRATH